MDQKNHEEQAVKDREWPNVIANKDALESALEEGEHSGVSARSVDEIVDETIADIKVNDDL